MRDTNEKMIELLDTFKEDNLYFAVIQHTIAGESLKLRFGILSLDFSHLKRILAFRPFENTGLAQYRYFFALSYHKDAENKQLAHAAVRVEQLSRHKQYKFITSIKFLSNILWFNALTDKKDIEAMIIH